MIPSDNTEKLLNAPPVNVPNRPVMGLLLWSPPASTLGSTPGRGMYAPRRYAANMANVNRSLNRSSGIFQALARDPNISTAPVPRRFRRQPLSSPSPIARTRAPLP